MSKRLQGLMVGSVLALAACGRVKDPQDFSSMSDMQIGNDIYAVHATRNFGRRDLTISKVRDDKSIHLTAQDIDCDGRFDDVTLRNVPKGHPLEQYVDLGKLEKVYTDAKETPRKIYTIKK